LTIILESKFHEVLFCIRRDCQKCREPIWWQRSFQIRYVRP